MPRVSRFDTAVNNLHAWAEKKKLKKADCGCCMFCDDNGYCRESDNQLSEICIDFWTDRPVYYRYEGCDMMERFNKEVRKQ